MEKIEKIAKEVEEGNIEHKLILRPDGERLIQLVSQLKWRLAEGMGEAQYELGVSDDGYLVGLTSEELESSVRILSEMAESLDADTSIMRKVKVEHNVHTSPLAKRFLIHQGNTSEERYAVEVLVRQRSKVLCPEIRCLVFGHLNVGKTSLLGLLADGDLDDGQGSTRLNILRHRHEVESGTTSCITQKSIGFSSNGSIVRSDIYWAEGSLEKSILESSSKVVTFIDTSGNPKYAKTLFSGFLGLPNYLCFVVSVLETGLTQYELELLKMSQVLNEVPSFLVATKIDLVDDNGLQKFLEAIRRQLQLPFIKSIPLVVNNENDISTCVSKLQIGIIPIFCISNVTGKNVFMLEKFLNLLPYHSFHSKNILNDLEFQIDEIFYIPHVGSVVGGLVLNGTIKVGEVYQIGPFTGGIAIPVEIKTIHRQRSVINELLSGQAGTVCICLLDGSPFIQHSKKYKLGKGMAILKTPKFENIIHANVEVISNEKSIKLSINMTGKVFIGSLQCNGTIKTLTNIENKRYSISIELTSLEWFKTGLKLIFYSSSNGLKCAGDVK